MCSLAFLTITAFLLSLALTPVLRDWSIRLGLMDRPDQKRKLHRHATPRTGGAPILLAYAGSYALLLLLPFNTSGLLEHQLAGVWRLLPPVGLIFITGLADDWLGLLPWQKVAGQLAGSVWAYAAGVRIASISGHHPPAWAAFVLTVAWLILCSNAFNLIDGVDGLATGVGLTATLTTFVAGVLRGDVMLALATAPLAGALTGFLRYNFNPASIFLGDSGSLTIGFLLGCYGIIWSQKSATMLGVAAPALALALPLLEVGLSISRRFLRNEPIFAGDRGHIHHRLLDRGFTPRGVALLLYSACGVGAALSILQSVLHSGFSGLVIVLFAAATLVGIRYLGYVEFVATRRFLWAGLRPMLRAHVELETLERTLAAAGSAPECWNAIEEAGRALGYTHMTGRIGARRFSTSPERGKDEAFWQMRLNLGNNCWVNITQREGATEQPALVIAFAEMVRRLLPAKLAELGECPSAVTEPIAESLAALAAAVAAADDQEPAEISLYSRTKSVISSNCLASPVNAATAS
jgi:UDP-GlcNAc:undecaprenyl-phosphate/decaprenyl-phosphate GlcNAc-1-phosphate transferase